MKRLLLPLALLAALCLPLGAAAQSTVQTTIRVVGTCGTAVYTAGNMAFPTQDTTGTLCTVGGGGGGGGAVTVANGADVAQGSTTDAACATDNGTCTINAVAKRVAQRLTTINTTLGTPFQAGGSIGNTAFNITVAGSAPSLTNPVFVANAEAADISGTFTNATQTTSITNTSADGYAAGLISVNGTYGTASGVFEISDDAGTTWYSVICGRSDGSASETGYTALTNTNRQWSCPVGGNDSLRVRSTAVASGTLNARVGISAPPPSSTTTFGTVTVAAGSAIIGKTSQVDSGGTDATDTTNHAVRVNVVTGAATGVAQGSTTSGQTGGLGQAAVTTAAPTYTTAQTSPISLDIHGGARSLLQDTTGAPIDYTTTSPTAQIGPYPSLNTAGVTSPATPETCASGNVANSTVACTLATAVGKTTYITGFTMTADGATVGLAVSCTLTGTITGTMTYTFGYPIGVAVPAQPLAITFPYPVPASATNTTIVASCPASGTGGTNAAITATGFQL